MIKQVLKMLVLSLTGECNYACNYCYAAEHNKQKMTLTTAIQAIALARAGGEPFTLQFSGGEPLLAYDLIRKIVAYLQQEKIPARLQIQTNASLLTTEMAQFFYANKVAIGVSLDGRPSVNDKNRKLKSGAGATYATLAGLNVLKKNGIAAGITCVVTDDNVRELPGIVEMAYYLGNIRRIGFDLLRGQGRGKGLKPPRAEDVKEALTATYSSATSFKAATKIGIKFSQIERVNILKTMQTVEAFGHCYAMNGQAAFVDASGEIYCCSSLIGNPQFHLGNVRTGIEPEKARKIAAKIKEAMNFCTSCKEFKLCGGGCFARWHGTGEKVAFASECALKKVSIKWAARQL